MERNTNPDMAVLPEAEAEAIQKKLRRKLPNVPMSISAMVDRKNRRLVHVAADNPRDFTSLDIYYPADKGVDRIVAHAVKKITLQFEL